MLKIDTHTLFSTRQLLPALEPQGMVGAHLWGTGQLGSAKACISSRYNDSGGIYCLSVCRQASAAWNGEFLDSAAAYCAVPLALALDVGSTARADGIQYRVGLHQARHTPAD